MAALAELLPPFRRNRDICATHERDSANTAAALTAGCAALLSRLEEVPHNGLYLLVAPSQAAARQAHDTLLQLGQHISFAPTPSRSPVPHGHPAAATQASVAAAGSPSMRSVAERVALVVSDTGTKVPPPPSQQAHILVGTIAALTAHCCARRASALRTEVVLFFAAERTLTSRTARLGHILRHRLGETQVRVRGLCAR